MHEGLLGPDAGTHLEDLADSNVAVVYIKEAADKAYDSDGWHGLTRCTAPPSLTRAVP